MKKPLTKTGTLRATFRHNSPNHKKIYLESKAILLISVGQQYHEGEKLKATINLINRSRFKKCFIMLGDSIQRHNLRINNFADNSTMHIKANKLGDEWLERNKPIYSKLTMPYEIIRWDKRLSHSSYSTYREAVNNLYQNNDSVKKVFLATADQFLKRYKKNNKEQINQERALELCLEYLLEECAIITILLAQDLCEFIIYPSKILDVMRITYNELFKSKYSNVLRWLPLRFKRKESYKDQP